jgi:hypothetical protein
LETAFIGRDEIQLIEQRTAWVNQLCQALEEYYPVLLGAFEDWITPASWDFVERFTGRIIEVLPPNWIRRSSNR